jgi:hypothetical protein
MDWRANFERLLLVYGYPAGIESDPLMRVKMEGETDLAVNTPLRRMTLATPLTGHQLCFKKVAGSGK